MWLNLWSLFRFFIELTYFLIPYNTNVYLKRALYTKLFLIPLQILFRFQQRGEVQKSMNLKRFMRLRVHDNATPFVCDWSIPDHFCSAPLVYLLIETHPFLKKQRILRTRKLQFVTFQINRISLSPKPRPHRLLQIVPQGFRLPDQFALSCY